MDYPLVSHEQEQQRRRRRGRPCAMERYHNERLQAQFSSLISQSSVDFDSDFAKLNIIPFITRRQRRARANDRERTRMQALNEALDVLKSCLPLELLLRDFETENSLKQKKAASLASASAATTNNNKAPSQGQCDTPATNTNTQVIKLTKIDTLKLASKYIAMLTRYLNGGGVGGCGDLIEWYSSGTMTESSTESPLDSPGGLVVGANYQNNINADFQADLSVNNRIGYLAYPPNANDYQHHYHSGFIQQTQNQSYHHQENDQLNSFYYKDEDTCTH
jgi:hypothetical protein